MPPLITTIEMRERIIAMLDFPRQLVRSEMELYECPHDGEFDNKDRICLECADGPECQWLYATDTVAALDSRSMPELAGALEFAIISVAANAVKMDHDPQQCRCQVCAWIQQAEVLRSEIQQHRAS